MSHEENNETNKEQAEEPDNWHFMDFPVGQDMKWHRGRLFIVPPSDSSIARTTSALKQVRERRRKK